MSILFDSAASVVKQQSALNKVLARPRLHEDGVKGQVTKAAIKEVREAAAKTSRGRDLALGVGGLTVGGLAALVSGAGALWAEHGAAITSADLPGLVAAVVPALLGLYKLLQQAFPRWL